ncbi:glycosyltransferase family 4 protein [Hydrogenophaga taeniospiralis]|uniref:glycosyltransferase family 4 protein n=1 Tax=Hydrogenophaga taeniospiralis TaxID=65656 RepID=UPI001CF96FC4|nr:glycosyltransferase family 4 protein [Hydrogenophaga taeniospiralis]UCU94178.1 glycosyltransferase family 4 protein [Hydrogenophaga taeniospiralis]
MPICPKSVDNAPEFVLLISKAYPPVVGGVETYAEEVAKAYLEKGLKPVILTQTTGPIGLRTVHYPCGVVDLYNVNSSGDSSGMLKQRNQPLSLIRMFNILPSIFRKYEFAFVHCTTWRPAVAVLPHLGKLPLILSIHGREVLNFPTLLRPFLSLIVNRATALVAVSNATLSIAGPALGKASVKKKGVRAFNGITFREQSFSFSRNYEITPPIIELLTVARLAARKNIQSCLIALSELRDSGVENFRYTIAGKGPLLPQLTRLAKDLKLEDKVSFLGYVPDCELPLLYQRSHVFLHPQTNEGEGNDFEGFGLVIADAMSFGCAVIAGKDGGPKDFVSHDVNGLIVDGSNLSDIVRSLRAVVTDQMLRNRLGSNAHAYALRELSWSNHVETIIQSITQHLETN